MDGFDSDATPPEQPSLSLAERLAILDHAYSNGARQTCVRLVNDLYAYFDGITDGAVSCLAVAGFAVLGILAPLS